MKRKSINGLEYEAYDIPLDGEGYPLHDWKKRFDDVEKVATFSAQMGIDRWEEDLYECYENVSFPDVDEILRTGCEIKWAVYFREGILLVWDRRPELMDILDGFLTAMKEMRANG